VHACRDVNSEGWIAGLAGQRERLGGKILGVRSRSPSLHEENQQKRYMKADVEGGFMGTCAVS
jgi:hypothetical protein